MVTAVTAKAESASANEIRKRRIGQDLLPIAARVGREGTSETPNPAFVK